MNGTLPADARVVDSALLAGHFHPMAAYAHRFAVAPMMDWTDRHCRFFHRLPTRRALLWEHLLH